MTQHDAAVHLRNFPLVWRWTDPRWSVIPSQAVRRIHTVGPDVARRDWPSLRAAADALMRHADLLVGALDDSDSELEPGSFARIDTKGDAQEVRATFVELGFSDVALLTVTWEPDLAVTMPAEVFCEFWNEFCYPASDDVVVVPANGEWVLVYHHEEEFLFGRMRLAT